ncbi:MAG TPA: hypothetical protein VGN82_05900 [Bosea sp. (in: a-proteobacteria)]|uniref:hypothetical protein n=1 Tax=Bosea sp. (in: a-proteobacteria) TaxID=1871050 RepID=UPI002E14897B|nr:hypothetical protein [Bosea sp. (in: a-proteobacteria)]
MLATTSLSLFLVSGAALADHQGHGAIPVGTGVELGPRLSAKVETTLQQDEQLQATAGQRKESDPAGGKPTPPRKVRVVYPAL